MSVHLSPIGNAFQFFNANGKPLSLGTLSTFAAGTSTPQTTYSDSAGVVPNANPIVLDASGRVQTEVWLTDGSAYKFVLKDSGGSTIGTYDNISGLGDPLSVVEPIILAAFSGSSGSSNVGFLQGGAGAVARTVQSKLRDFIDVRDFGATGNGSTDDTAAIAAAYAYAVTLGSATVYFPAGTYKVTSAITIGSGAGTFTSISTVGDGAVNTILAWHGSTSGTTMLTYTRNKYAHMVGVTLQNAAGSTGTTVGLWLTGPASGTQSNNHQFENVIFQGFHKGVRAGDDGTGAAASELNFVLCDFTLGDYGFYGEASGNTLNIWFRGCSFTSNSQYGCWGGTSGCIHFYGGASHGNTVGFLNLQTNWAVVCTIQGMRHELTPPEIAYNIGTLNEVRVEGCFFITTGSVPTYPVITGANYQISFKGCQWGQGADTGWMVLDGTDGNGVNCFVDMEGCRILGTNPFEISGGTTATDALRYNLRGNYYNGAMHGTEIGRVVWPNRTADVVTGTATFASAATVAVTVTARENATYTVAISGSANETFWITGKSTTGFTLHSSNATSAASVDWSLSR